MHAAVETRARICCTHARAHARTRARPSLPRAGPAQYTRHAQLRVAKGTYWDQFMAFLNWCNNTLPVFDPHTKWRRT